MWPIFVLLWKHLAVRKRRFIHTPIQISSTVWFLIVLYWLDININKGETPPTTPRPGNGESTENALLSDDRRAYNYKTYDVRGPLRVVYWPQSPAADALMGEVGAKLRLRRLDHLPDDDEIGYAAFTDNESLADYTWRMQSRDAIVIFKDEPTGSVNESAPLPLELEYTIRMKSDFNTPSYELPDDWGANYISSPVYEPFVSLQWALDTSYLHLLTGVDCNQTLMLQESAQLSIMAIIVSQVLGALCSLSHFLVFANLVTTILDEKNTGIQELLKMVGVSVNTVMLSHFLNMLLPGLAYCCIGAGLCKIAHSPLLPYTGGGLIIIALLLHHVTVMAVGICVASLTSSSHRQATIVFIIYIALFLVGLWGRKLIFQPRKNVLALILPPHGGLYKFFGHVAAAELFNRPATFDKVSGAFLIMLLQTVFFLLLGCYFAHLFPGAYGRRLPWNYLCQGKNPPVATEVPLLQRDERYFEKTQPGRPIGIQIHDVTMKFPNNVALSHVSLNALKGEITVLLGHNGAGKTTLMNIITGMLTPTTGRVLVNGMDTSTQLKAVRSQLGLCPQHNLYYSDLSVENHYKLFALLKGSDFNKATKSCNGLLKQLNLADKSGAMVNELSGGMKRRVQLACALAGGANVLVLDEPTSGLDVETRRELWDMLLDLRGDRTVLLTTHFMEEADALGDRIAALHTGQLKCFATPMFLKRAIGTGYRLSFTTVKAANEAAITALIRATIPEATVRDQSLKAISYNLPAKDSQHFPALFTAIEARKRELGIDSMGVGKSTLDEVFLKLCTDLTSQEVDQATSTSGLAPVVVYRKITGYRLHARRFKMLIKRQYLYMTSKKMSFYLLQVAIPLVAVIGLTWYVADARVVTDGKSPAIALNLDLYRDMPQRRVLYNVELGKEVPLFRSRYKDVEFEGVNEVTGGMLDKDFKYLAGIELNNTHAKAVYTSAVRYAAPVAVNLVSNALAARLAGAAARITAYDHPLPVEPLASAIVGPKKPFHTHAWCVTVALISLVQLSSNIQLPCSEREAGTRHIHFMCGCPLPLHWAATFVAHVGLAALTVLLPACLLAFMDRDSTINQLDFLASYFLICMLGLVATCAMNNNISMLMSESRAANLTLAIVFGWGFVLALMQKFAMEGNEDITGSFIYTYVEIFYCTISPQTMVAGAYQMARVAGVNAWCKLNRRHCPNLYIDNEHVDDKKCCESTGAIQSYFSMDSKGGGGELVVIIAQIIVYTTTLWLMDSNILAKYFGTRAYVKKSRFNDPSISSEKIYVEKQLKLEKHNVKDAVLCYDIYKSYLTNGFSMLAVKGISFSVSKGECFGLLGVNGAGKTTTFKMLNGEEHLSHGTLFANGYYSTQRTPYMQTYSYCGQFFGLDSFLTGRQNLDLLLTLRGLKAADAAKETVSWIEEIGLTKYADRRVSTYSGGCARRLAAAAALCQRARAALLDEPTAGVDPVARRRVHAAVMRAKRDGGSIVIASHSMDEMEALCDRMCIISGGQICALGSATQLRTQHAQGFSAVFKLFLKDELYVDVAAGVGSGTSVSTVVNNELLDAEMHRLFDCVLIDDRRIIVQYHINNVMPYSELFGHMESIKQKFPQLIEDYSVTETTLEEVFLSFAKEAIDHKQMLQQRTRERKREHFFKKWQKPNRRTQP